MPADLGEVRVPPEVACVAVGRDATTVRRWVRESRIRNYGTDRKVVVSLAEVLEVGGDAISIG